MAYNLIDLPEYVKQNKDVLVKSVVLGDVYGDTIPMIRKRFGVKCTESLNLLDVEAPLQNGAGCGFEQDGDDNLSNRLITVAPIKVNKSWCPDELLCSVSEEMVRLGANANAEDGFPYEREILSEVEKNINKQMEDLVWNGDHAGGDLIDGFITLAVSADSASTIVPAFTADTASTHPVYDAIKAVVMDIPEEILDEAVVFISPANFRKFALELVENFKYNAQMFAGEIEMKDILFPGSTVKVHKTMGLSGSDFIYATTPSNMVYGTDMLNDKEEFRIWFSDDADEYRMKAKWSAGVQTIYPDEVVLLEL